MDWKSFVKKRAGGIFDNLVANLLILLGAAVGIGGVVAAVIFLQKSVSVQAWELVVIAILLVALIAGEILLAKALRELQRVQPPPEQMPAAPQQMPAAPQPPARHAGLINRIDALNKELANMHADASARQAVGSTYNDLLQEARRDIPTGVPDSIQLAQFRNAKWADVDNSQIKVWLSQIRVLLVEDAQRPSGRQTDIKFH